MSGAGAALLLLVASAAGAKDAGEPGASEGETPSDAGTGSRPAQVGISSEVDGGLVESDGGAGTSAPGAPVLAIEEFEPAGAASTPPQAVESFEAPPSQARVQVFGSARAQLGVDTRLESAPTDELRENVFDLRGRARLGADVKLSSALRLLLEGRALWRGTAERALRRAKASFEPTLGDAFVDIYAEKVDLRVGHQIVAFGANAAFAPSDSLNPRDLREGLLAEPEDGKLPALALRALGEIGRVQWTAAYFPFFTPSRYSVFGQDEAMVQPSLGAAIPARFHESIEDGLQPHLLETERPKAFPYLGDLGLRAVVPTGKVKLGGSWVWMYEKVPQVRLDPELSALLSQQAKKGEVDSALALSVQNRLAAGEELFTGIYARQHILSIEASALLGSAQLDLDLAYSPRQTFFDASLEPLRKASYTWVFGVSQAADSPLIYSLTYLGLAVPDVGARELLILLEPTTAEGAPRTAWLHLLVGEVGYRLFDDKLELSLRGAFEPIQRSFALAPRVSYKGLERTALWLGAELYEGGAYSPMGYFDRNDQIAAGAAMELW